MGATGVIAARCKSLGQQGSAASTQCAQLVQQGLRVGGEDQAVYGASPAEQARQGSPACVLQMSVFGSSTPAHVCTRLYSRCEDAMAASMHCGQPAHCCVLA